MASTAASVICALLPKGVSTCSTQRILDRLAMSAFVCSPHSLASSWARGSPRCAFTNSESQMRVPTHAAHPVAIERCAVIRMGLLPLVPDWITFGAWFYGAYRFYVGFDSTSYQPSYRLPLAAAWPLFAIFNPSYRKNFMKALKKGDD